MRLSSLVAMGFAMLLTSSFCLFAQNEEVRPDIGKAVIVEQAKGLEAVETPLEEHLQEQAVESDATDESEYIENPEEIFEAAVPGEIPFEEVDDDYVATDAQQIEPESEKVYEKAETLEPALMMRGSPSEEANESVKKERIRGRIIPEKHNIKRRRYMFRWVLQTDDGKRIPLKSNLQLLTLVRKEELLDGPAMLTGYFVASGINSDLKYFNVEKAVPAGDSDEKDEKKRTLPKKKSKAPKN